MKSDTHKPSISDEESSKLSETVYRPAFFAKLASYGIQPSNEVDEDQLRKLAVALENLGALGSRAPKRPDSSFFADAIAANDNIGSTKGAT